VKLADLKGISIVTGYKIIIIEFLLYFGLFEEVGCILGILNEFPDPSDLCVGV
jgi:hypothetical protein